jgi:UDP-glucose 4-epimerase
MARYVVTGAAGFIGSAVVDRLLADGETVVGVDDLSSGKRRFLEGALANPRFRLELRNIYLPGSLDGLLSPEVNTVFHLAANADVRFGPERPRRDLEQNTIATWNVLEAMRNAGARHVVFSSTGSVYGEPPVFPTPEDCPFPVQTSLYGASKLAAEGLCQAYAESFDLGATIFRFVSIVGERYQHGHVLDFVAQLKRDPSRLRVLGNGGQRKSYLYVGDCLEAMWTAIRARGAARVQTFNLGTDQVVTVDDSIGVICDELGLSPVREYTGGERGWVGDSPMILLDCARIRALGWTPRVTIREGIRRSVRWIVGNPWILPEARA